MQISVSDFIVEQFSLLAYIVRKVPERTETPFRFAKRIFTIVQFYRD